nr:alpha-L-rhamnosidase [Bacteroidales bacterium]
YPSERTLQNTFVLFRKDFTLGEVPGEAKGWIVADSRYRLFVNGERVQWGPAPSDPRWQEADPVDIASYLRKGNNTIAVEVCFFGSGDGTAPIGKPGLLLKIGIGNQNIISDPSWSCSLARSWEPGKYKRWFLRSLQECFDARCYPYGWMDAGYEMAEGWLPAKVYGRGDKPSICNRYRDYLWESRNGRPDVEIRERSVPLMREKCIDNPKLKETMLLEWKVPAENFFDMAMDASAYSVEDWKVLEHSPEDSVFVIQPAEEKTASYVFAFDEQGVGFPYFSIDAPEGTVVEMLVHEAHDPGHAAVMNSHFHSWTRYICKEGFNHFESFDFESYRWVQFLIRNFDRPVSLSGIGMRRRTYPWAEMPRIKVQDDTLQRVVNATINTLNNCAQETIVDGMARERQQYSGDGGHQIHALYQFFRPEPLLARYVNIFSQGSSIEGFFMDSWPGWDRMVRVFERQLQMTAWGPILDHSIGFVFDVYNYYMYSGNKDNLKEVYPRLVKFYKYMKSLTDMEDGLIPSVGLGMCSVYMDQRAYRNDREKELALNLYVAAMCKHAMAPLCELFDDTELKKDVLEYGRSVHEACIKKYWDVDKKVFVNNLPSRDEEGEDRYCDRSLSTALIFDMCPDGAYQQCLDLLVRQPANLGQSYPCNLVWPMWALVKYRRMDVVLDQLRSRWGKMRSVWENNTLEEFFDSKADDSSQWSHSAVMPLIALAQGIAGITPLKPDGSLIKIKPQPAGLDGVEFDVWTQRGPVHFKYAGKKGKNLFLDIPEGVDAELWLDAGEKVKLPLLREEPGGFRVYLARNLVYLHIEKR